MKAVATVAVDRDELRAELRRTQDAFRAYVRGLPERQWSRPLAGTRWTGRQVCHHVTWALEQLPREVTSASREKGMFNYPKFLAESGSLWLVRWEARKQTRDSILARYDAAIEEVMQSLDRVEEHDWQRGARFYGERFYSVADLFHTPANHFHEHCGHLV